MFNFDLNRYHKTVDGAIALRSEIEKAADEVCRKGYKNLFLIGCGGTYSHFLPIKYMIETNSTIEVHVEIAAEFLLMNNKNFGRDSLCIFTSRTGNTKEIVAAAKYCKEHGAMTVGFVAHQGTPLCDEVDKTFINFAEDDNLAESIYLQTMPFIFRLMYNRSEFADYERLFMQIDKIAPFLVKAKEATEEKAERFANRHKETGYHMVVGSGNIWGEAYDYAMCILEEMQWIRTKSIHAAEFFHGTLELVEEDTSILLLYGEDETRPLMDRVKAFATKVSKEVTVFDTKDYDLPLDGDLRKYVSPIVIYAVLERVSCYLEHYRNHPLTTRRYYRQFEY